MEVSTPSPTYEAHQSLLFLLLVSLMTLHMLLSMWCADNWMTVICFTTGSLSVPGWKAKLQHEFLLAADGYDYFQCTPKGAFSKGKLQDIFNQVCFVWGLFVCFVLCTHCQKVLPLSFASLNRQGEWGNAFYCINFHWWKRHAFEVYRALLPTEVGPAKGIT